MHNLISRSTLRNVAFLALVALSIHAHSAVDIYAQHALFDLREKTFHYHDHVEMRTDTLVLNGNTLMIEGCAQGWAWKLARDAENPLDHIHIHRTNPALHVQAYQARFHPLHQHLELEGDVTIDSETLSFSGQTFRYPLTTKGKS